MEALWSTGKKSPARRFKRFRDRDGGVVAKNRRKRARRWLAEARWRRIGYRVVRPVWLLALTPRAVRLHQDERCTGRESPSGNFSAGRTARSAVRGRWNGRSRRRTFQRQEDKCLRRGIGLRRGGPGRPSSGP